jgi:hypothetical protein
MTYPEWADQGRWLGTIGRCSQWWLGDWIRYGTARYGEKYTEAAKLTDYEVHSLRNMAYVASRFPDVSRRRDKLSWSHHAELAALNPEEQDKWLSRAANEKLSVSALRTALRESRQPRESASDDGDAIVDSQPLDKHSGTIACPSCGYTFPAQGLDAGDDGASQRTANLATA